MTRINIHGRLDTANQYIAESLGVISKAWQEGSIRMRQEDITRAEKYLKTITLSCKQLRGTLKEFKAIAPVRYTDNLDKA